MPATLKSEHDLAHFVTCDCRGVRGVEQEARHDLSAELGFLGHLERAQGEVVELALGPDDGAAADHFRLARIVGSLRDGALRWPAGSVAWVGTDAATLPLHLQLLPAWLLCLQLACAQVLVQCLRVGAAGLPVHLPGVLPAPVLAGGERAGRAPAGR